MKKVSYLASLVLASYVFAGCVSPPNYYLSKPLVVSKSLIRKNVDNKYCILLKGIKSIYTGNSASSEDLEKYSIPQEDKFVTSDIENMIKLANLKGYDCYQPTKGEELANLLDDISAVSDELTQTLVVASGECDEKGFNLNLVRVNDSINLLPQDYKIKADKLIERLSEIKGTKALIVSGCQSGSFAVAAEQNKEFKGVVITACPVGFATTQCENSQTTSLFAGFFDLYKDSNIILDLSDVEVKAGSSFENFRHKLSDLFESGLPISYKVVKFSNATFKF